MLLWCVLVVCIYCYHAFSLKLHPFCSSYAPFLLLFGGDFLFILYDKGKVITFPEFKSLFHSYSGAIIRLASVRSILICSHRMLCSRFVLFHSDSRGCICWVFSLEFSLLCSFFHFLIYNELCALKSPSSITSAGNCSMKSLISSWVIWSILSILFFFFSQPIRPPVLPSGGLFLCLLSCVLFLL